MFSISDLSKQYDYDDSVQKSVLDVLVNTHLDRKNPYHIIAFIDDFARANKWLWDRVTFYNCKRIEYFIQEKVPTRITDKKEIHQWIVNNWKKYYFPVFDNISLN
jgi:hypothetical protein